MKDRIQLDGIWYVKETPSPVLEIDMLDITDCLICIYEPNNWCFEASVTLKDDAVLVKDVYGDPWIEVTDKRPANRADWVIENLDNPHWFLGVLEGSSESMEEANKMFDEQGLKEFRSFIKHLIDKGWLKIG
jgi:hypothetical protein